MLLFIVISWFNWLLLIIVCVVLRMVLYCWWWFISIGMLFVVVVVMSCWVLSRVLVIGFFISIGMCCVM